MALWENVRENLVEWYGVAADKTEVMAKIGMRRYDKFGISRDIERQMTELGGLVYQALDEQREAVFVEPKFEAIVTRIRQLENELKAKEEEIDSIKAENQERKAAAATAGGAPEVLITEPILAEGSEESAILVEPAEEVVIEVDSVPEEDLKADPQDPPKVDGEAT